MWSNTDLETKAAKRREYRALKAERKKETASPVVRHSELAIPEIQQRLRTNRRNTTSALVLAHAHLNYTKPDWLGTEASAEIWNSLSSNPSGEGSDYHSSRSGLEMLPSDEGSSIVDVLLTRQSTYATLLAAFLTHRYGVVPARSILHRQLSEGIPLPVAIATLILQRTLSQAAAADIPFGGGLGSGPQSLITSLEQIMPYLPAQMDPDLLALVLTAIVRENAPSPDVVREMIVACLRNAPGSADPADPNSWPWPLWTAYILSFLPHMDFRGAITELGDFRALVASARTEAVGAGRAWPDERIKTVEVAYTSVMSMWSRSRFSGGAVQRRRARQRFESRIPSQLAQDLEDLLRPASGMSETRIMAGSRPLQSASLPLPFLNAWLDAERIAGNLTNAAQVWKRISGQTVSETVSPGHPITSPRRNKSRHGPDGNSYSALFKLLKLSPPPSYRPVVARVLAFLSGKNSSKPRSSPGTDHAVSSTPPSSTPSPLRASNTSLLNTILSALAVSPSSPTGSGPDVQLILYLLRTLSASGNRPVCAPDARTIDLAGSAIIRAMRATRDSSSHPSGGQSTSPSGPLTAEAPDTPESIDLDLPPFPTPHAEQPGISLNEWRWISRALSAVAPITPNSPTPEIVLPLSQPRAEAHAVANTDPDTSPEVPEVETHRVVFGVSDPEGEGEWTGRGLLPGPGTDVTESQRAEEVSACLGGTGADAETTSKTRTTPTAPTTPTDPTAVTAPLPTPPNTPTPTHISPASQALPAILSLLEHLIALTTPIPTDPSHSPHPIQSPPSPNTKSDSQVVDQAMAEVETEVAPRLRAK